MTDIKAALEAVLFAAGESVPVDRLSLVFAAEQEQILMAAKELSEEYDAQKKAYDKAYNAYCAVEQLLIKHKRDLLCSQFYKYFEFVNSWINWISVTVLLSLISALVAFFL